MEKLKPKDFIEIEYTGKTEDSNVFDSNIKGDLEKIPNQDPKQMAQRAKPFVFPLGQEMFLKGAEDFLVGKEPGKSYEINLTPENAFGLRDPKLIHITSLKKFHDQKINPIPGAVLNFDGQAGKILSVNGGRVRIDFNHPLAGKALKYKVNVKRVVTDLNEKIKAFTEFLFRQEFKFKVDKEKKKIILELNEQQKGMKQFIRMFKEKFKEIFDMELEVEESKKPQ